ncbi:MAG: hypothetical protein KJO32_14865 [Deltaproteobacteria bacterium]|nr:hypothetical protein [Deltaproteobacteria bacterium]
MNNITRPDSSDKTTHLDQSATNHKKQRRRMRLEAETGIAVTPYGICQIIDLTRDGFSFKCVKQTEFPSEWSMDIHVTTGLSLEQLQVKKVWVKFLQDRNNQTPFSMELGGQFMELSPEQEEQLNTYLQELEKTD